MKLLGSLFVVFMLAATSASNNHKNVVNFVVEPCHLKFSTNCGESASPVGHIIDITFNGSCVNPGIADLKRGTVIQIDFKFQAYNDESVLTSHVEGKLGIFPWVPFPLDNPDACKNSGLTCPIKANTTVDYTPELNVLKSYPLASQVLVRWKLQNKSGANVFCVVMPASITD